MAVSKGNVGSSVVAEFGERSMLAAGAKAGLKPVFQMSQFIGKSAGFTAKLAYARDWGEDFDGPYEIKMWGFAKGIKNGGNASNLSFGSSSGRFEGMEVMQVMESNDLWGSTLVVVLKPVNYKGKLLLTVAGVSQEVKWGDYQKAHYNPTISKAMSNALRNNNGKTVTISIRRI